MTTPFLLNRCWLTDSRLGTAPPEVFEDLYAIAGQVPAFDVDYTQRTITDRVSGIVAVFTRPSSVKLLWNGTQLQSYPADVPGFELRNGIWEYVHEPAATNIAIRSEEFDNAAWAKNTTTVTANNTTAPDGASTADLVAGAAGTQNKFLTGNFSALTVGAYTFSVFLKAGTESFVELRLTDGSANGVRCRFNLSAGTAAAATSEGTATGQSAAIVTLGDGWYRCIVSCTVASLPNSLMQPQLWLNAFAPNSLTTNYWAWGAQLEIGPVATSYIPTSGSAVTRAADTLTVSGAPFASFYSPLGGAWYAEVVAPAGVQAIGTAAVIGLDNNTTNEMAYIVRNVDRALRVQSRSSAVIDADFNSVTLMTDSSAHKLAVRMSANNYASSLNGNAPSLDASVIMPSVTQLRIGSHQFTGTWIGGIRRLTYWPPGPAQSRLQQLTT